MNAELLQQLGTEIDEVFFIIGAAIFSIEILKAIVTRSLKGRTVLDMIASVSTQLPFLLVEIFILSFAYAGYSYLSENFISWTTPISPWTAVLAVVAADFIYYWEHRLSHETRVLWTQHAVHHSSRHMNTIVGIRFGPFEGVFTVIVHLPLLLVGFPAELIFFGILVVLAYQTWIHTEVIGGLGFIDGLVNTPANHRVHHSCDEKYIDKNYGGILMIWDKLFGTYQREDELPNYGLKRDFDSVNPLKVWFSELPALFKDLRTTQSLGHSFRVIFGPPAHRSTIELDEP